MGKKTATTRTPVHEIIANRWSPRAFDMHRNLSDTQLVALVEAARWSPSCFNEQPWRFIVCDRSRDEQQWQAVLERLAEKNQRWAKNAPVLIVVSAMEAFSRNGDPNRWAQYDTGAAAVSLSFQAVAMGLAVHQMGGFNEQAMRDHFHIPDDCTVMAVMAIGYQAHESVLDEEFVTPEQAARAREELDSSFYLGHWGNGIAREISG